MGQGKERKEGREKKKTILKNAINRKKKTEGEWGEVRNISRTQNAREQHLPNSEIFTSNKCTLKPWDTKACQWKLFSRCWPSTQWIPEHVLIQTREWEGRSSKAIPYLSRLKYGPNATATFSLWELCPKRTLAL